MTIVSETETFVCDSCDSDSNDELSVHTSDGLHICEACFEADYGYCDWTGEVVEQSELTEVRVQGYNIPSDRRMERSGYSWHDLNVCSDVLSDYFTRCCRCDEYAHNDETASVGWSNSVCSDCYENHYFRCDRCEEVFHNDRYGGDGECEECHSREDDSDDCDLIYSYSTDPMRHLSFQGSPSDGIYFGIELETQSPQGELQTNANLCASLLESYAILKADASVPGGFEIVTAPATLEIHKSKWDEFLDKRPGDLTSWKSGDCGMHIHISRKPLSQLTIGKLLVFVNDRKNADFIRAIAGRTSDKYAAIKPWKKICDCRSGSDRYEAINLSNSNTIEFRIFRGTLHKQHFMANLEFCHAVVYYCQNASMQRLAWQDFMCWVLIQPKSMYPNLIGYMKEKGFYVA